MFNRVSHRLRATLQHAWSSKFLRSASVLAGGTAAAQAIGLLALPFLTRIYTPSDFNLLAVYMASIALFLSVGSLCLELAIPLPEKDEEAANLLVLALSSVGVVSVLIFLVLLVFAPWVFASDGLAPLERYRALIPFGIWLAGSYTVLQYWATRRKWFGRIAITKFSQVGTGVASQIGLGLAGIGAFGLLLGHALMSGAGIVYLGKFLVRDMRRLAAAVSPAAMMAALRRYRNFPTYSVLGSVAGNGVRQVPILIIAAIAAGPEAGFLLLALRALSAPIQLIGTSVSQVYLASAAQEWRDGRLYVVTLTLMRNLLLFVAIPIALLIFVGAPLFDNVFGAQWTRSGEIAVWLAPMIAAQSVVNPISMVMNVVGRQRQLLILRLVSFAFICVAVYVGAIQFGRAVEAFAIARFLIYLGLAGVFIRVARTPHP